MKMVALLYNYVGYNDEAVNYIYSISNQILGPEAYEYNKHKVMFKFYKSLDKTGKYIKKAGYRTISNWLNEDNPEYYDSLFKKPVVADFHSSPEFCWCHFDKKYRGAIFSSEKDMLDKIFPDLSKF